MLDQCLKVKIKWENILIYFKVKLFHSLSLTHECVLGLLKTNTCFFIEAQNISIACV